MAERRLSVVEGGGAARSHEASGESEVTLVERDEFGDLRAEVMKKLTMPEVSVDRCRLVTQSYKETEGQPMIIRRAKAFHKVLSEIGLTIEPWQLVVGNFATAPFETSIYPEYAAAWILDEMEQLATRRGDKFLVSEDAKGELVEIIPYWAGKTVEEAVNNMLPGSVRTAEMESLISSAVKNEGIGQFLPDYEKVLRTGFRGIAKRIAEAKEKSDPTRGDYLKRTLFYDAALICCDAVRIYAQRYAALAKDLASKAKSQRKKDLLKIAEICERVPEHPARSFLEALQSFWFTHILMSVASAGQGITVGRFDQYMYPYYTEDLDDGGLTREEAKRWLKSCWVNFNQILTFYPEKTALIWAGYPIAQQPEIGGVKSDGTDATNDLSHLILEVEAEVSLHQPDLGVIYHRNMADDFLLKACQVLPLGGKPKFFNYDVSIMQLLGKGATLQEARRDCAYVGCVEPNLVGKSWGPNNCGFVNLAKCLELALNNGSSLQSGADVGPRTGDPEALSSFDKLMAALKEQIRFAVAQHMILNHAIEIAHRELMPLPFESLMVEGCIEKGMDLTAGGAYLNKPAIEGVGLANVADSLMAVKKFVFDERSITMGELHDALRTNFEGQEILRQKLIHGAPKYGNDVDEVDFLAREIAMFYSDEVAQYVSPRGVTYCAGLYSVSAHAGTGMGVGATPDGSKAGEPLSDGVSPTQGVCENGPTAVIRSVCKIDHGAVPNGTLLNMKFPSGIMDDERKLRKFGHLLRTFMDLGGYHVQFNVVDTATLIAAQEHPEDYPELLVRVAAYVALFTQLPRELQDDIIRRSELAV